MILHNLETNSNTLIRDNDLDFHIVNSQAELSLTELIDCDAIIFRSDRVSTIKQEIVKIRKADNPGLYLKPIFVSSKRVKSRLQDEVDGVVMSSNLESISESTKELKARIRKVNPQPLSPDIPFHNRVLLKTMQFMYTRDVKLKPKRDRSALMGYHYPFVQLLLPAFETASFLDKVQLATKRNWFNTKMQDKVNLCRSCGGSYLHFVETCHKCHSIDIEAEHLIHHFRCAYIGPESDFKQEDILVCPKCDKVLRHIGVDYDKPSEILTCNSCNHQAQQSSIHANCIDCGEDNELSKLHSRTISVLSLAIEGAEIATSGTAFDLIAEEISAKAHKYEIESTVFDLLRKQEIKKTSGNKEKSYTMTISFAADILNNLSVNEKIIFENEFKDVIGNYLEDVDLMTTRGISHYELLMSNKPVSYMADMKATLDYNVTKILDDNLGDPDHQLSVNYTLLDDNFQGH